MTANSTGGAAPEPGGPGRLDRDSDEPLWQQLLVDLRRRLQRDDFDRSFPGELRLCQQYAVSRYTVREALRRLRDEGLVLAARGRPPRLGSEAEIEQPLGAVYSLFASVEAAGLEQRSVVRVLEVRRDAHVAVRLGLEESTPLLYLERLRLADGEPLAHDQVWLPAELTDPLLSVDFSRTALYRELADRCGLRLTGGYEQLRAVVPNPFQRNLLDVGTNVAAFAIERLGCIRGVPTEWRATLIRADRFSVLAEFSARTGYQMNLGRSVDADVLATPTV